MSLRFGVQARAGVNIVLDIPKPLLELDNALANRSRNIGQPSPKDKECDEPDGNPFRPTWETKYGWREWVH